MFDWFKHPRLNELIVDGYMAIYQGRYIVTAKGLAALFACADRPISSGQLSVTSLAFERFNDSIGGVRARPSITRARGSR